MEKIILIAILLAVAAFFLPFAECYGANSFSLSGLLHNLKKWGENIASELLMLVGVLVVFFIAYLILDELGDSHPGCIYVPLVVMLWIILRGMYLPLGFVKNFGSIWRSIVFIFLGFVLYKGVIWWITDMMICAKSLIAAAVFGAILVAFARYMGKIAYGFIACACEK